MQGLPPFALSLQPCSVYEGLQNILVGYNLLL